MEKKKGVYILGNLVEKNVYIGSSIDLKARVKKHFSELKHNKHSNYKLQNAFNEDNTQFLAITIPANGDVNIREIEQQLLNEFAPTGKLYNIAINVECPMEGKKHAPETIEKLKELAVGRVPPREAVENSVKARLGVPLSPERVEALRVKGIEAMKDPAARQHLSDVNVGIKHTPETIEKMKEICKDRTFTPQARAASLEANIGRKLSEEHIQAIKNANTGIVRSEETRAKMSEAKRGITPPQSTINAIKLANTGRVKSQEELDVCRATLVEQNALRSKKVVADGITFNSISEAARELNIDKGTIHRRAANEKFSNWNYA